MNLIMKSLSYRSTGEYWFAHQMKRFGLIIIFKHFHVQRLQRTSTTVPRFYEGL